MVFQDSQNQRKGLHVFLDDRFYTSPELAQELLKINCNLTGTVMANRAGMPNGLKQKGIKMKRGDLCAREGVQRKGSVLVLTWKDKRPALFTMVEEIRQLLCQICQMAKLA